MHGTAMRSSARRRYAECGAPPTVRGAPWQSEQPHAEASTPPALSQHAARRRPAGLAWPPAWVQHMRPPPRRTATWPHVYGRAGARDGKRARLPSAPLRWSRFATRGVAARPHATRCTAISRPARGRSRTRCKASAACRRVMASAGVADSQRSEQLRAALNEGSSPRASSEGGTTQVRSRM